MKKLFALAVLSVFMMYINSCIKARQCSCYNSSTQHTDTIFINGTKKDARKACVNLADSNETCTLK